MWFGGSGCVARCLAPEGQELSEESIPTASYAAAVVDAATGDVFIREGDGIGAGCFQIASGCKRRSCKPGGQLAPFEGAEPATPKREEEGGGPDECGGWRPHDRAYYVGGGEAFQNGDVEPRGATVEILGEDEWRQDFLRVRFPGSKTPTSIPAEALSSRPVPLRGGWLSAQLAYLKAAPTDCADATGLLVKVIGDDPSRPSMLAVQVAGSSAIISADPQSLVVYEAELPGGWRPLEQGYYTGHGESFENGDTEPQGAAVVVLGHDACWPGMVRVKFPHSRSPTAVDPAELARSPVALHGGWLSLDVAFYAGGTRVEIIGNDHASPGMLACCLPDSGAIVVADPARLSRADAGGSEAELEQGKRFPSSSAASTAVTPQASGGDLLNARDANQSV